MQLTCKCGRTLTVTGNLSPRATYTCAACIDATPIRLPSGEFVTNVQGDERQRMVRDAKPAGAAYLSSGAWLSEFWPGQPD